MTLVQSLARLDSPQELERRLAVVRPGDTACGYFFNCALDEIRRQGDAALLRRSIDVAGQEKFAAFFNYPITSLLQLVYTAAWGLSEKHGGFEGAMWHLGSHVAQEFLRNTVGRTMLLLAGKNPKRLAEGLPSAYRTGWQHGASTVQSSGPGRYTAFIHGNVIPHPYFEGVLSEVLIATGVANVKVTGRQIGPADSEFSLSWG
ncbi:DUF2378 family protein [Archangium lipolyticum]|uniref:DUF2378 family protein n=1 Tax=Archangium lipolyticum TaxID=2970465 RepID=UPI00214A5805|nr:DUF2378 family protein [Archangium lipolyticum]